MLPLLLAITLLVHAPCQAESLFHRNLSSKESYSPPALEFVLDNLQPVENTCTSGSISRNRSEGDLAVTFLVVPDDWKDDATLENVVIPAGQTSVDIELCVSACAEGGGIRAQAPGYKSDAVVVKVTNMCV